MPPVPNTAAAAAGLARLRRAHLRSVYAHLEKQNAAASMARKALPADPRKSRPPAVAPAPGGGVVGRLEDRQLRLSRGMRRMVLIANLRIGRWDEDWRPLPTIVAEMRGGCLEGELTPGDWVQLPKGYDPGQPLSELMNLWTNERVEMRHKRVKDLGDIAPLSLAYL